MYVPIQHASLDVPQLTMMWGDLVGMLVGILVAVLCVCLIWCMAPAEVEEGHNAAAAGPSSGTTPGSQRPPATAPARIKEPQQLAYFSYPAGSDEEGGKRTARTSVVCAICLEALVGGAECSEVPACRHAFHRGCLALWMKCKSTCPLCRELVVPGSDSEPLTAAEAMV